MPDPSSPILNTCPECAGIIDATAVRPYEKVACPHCGQAVRVRTRFGKFTITGEIGEGGMSRVFRAQDTTLGREVALKILHSHYGDDPELVSLFEREARVTASMNHPNVVRLYSVGHDQGYLYLAMELLRSEGLESQLTHGPIPEAASLRIIHEVALGLDNAFRHGLIHRDIKPGNILLDQHGTAKLVDFGLALVLGADEQSQDLWATPYYVPPEKLRGAPDDLRGDIYSLGATLFHMLAGAPPHAADTYSVEELLEIKSRPVQLRTAAPKARATTVRLVQRMMAFDPEDRFSSYDGLLTEIEDARARADRSFVLPRHRRPFPVWARAALVLAACGLAGSWLWWSLHTPPRPADLEVSTPQSGPTGGAVVLTAADNTRLRTVEVARQAYAAGNRDEAIRLFDAAAADDRLRPDLRAWATFHLGMEDAARGDAAAAADRFRAAAAHFGPDAPESSPAAWFLALADGSPAENDPLAGLVRAYAMWHAGEFAAASPLLDQYRNAAFPPGESWKALYRDACAPMATDAALLVSPPTDPPSRSLADVQAALDAWTALLGKLRLEPARAVAQAKVKALGTALVEVETALAQVVRRRDEALLSTAGSETAAHAGRRDFTAAAAVWAAIRPESDWGRKQATSSREACELAGKFVTDLLSALTRHGYTGEILRASGAPFRAKIVSATPERLLVDLGFGPTPVDLSAVSSAGLFRIAEATLLPEAAPETLQGAALFAWFTGQEAAARELARGLEKEPGFARRWEAVTVPPEFR